MRTDIIRENIARLLKAASIIDRKEREAEHGYASTAPPPALTRRRTNSKSRRSPTGSRYNHNELEKNRRAHLRMCLDKLKSVVPLNSHSTRHTTLALINRAKTLIMSLRESEKRLKAEYEREVRAGGMLRRRLDRLTRLQQNSASSPTPHEYSSSAPTHRYSTSDHEYSIGGGSMGWYRTGQSVHSLSESSTTSRHSSSSALSSSELDEVDVIGLDGSVGSGSPIDQLEIEEQESLEQDLTTSLYRSATIDQVYHVTDNAGTLLVL